MCRAVIEGGRRCPHAGTAARVARRRRAKARARLEADAAGEVELDAYQRMIALGSTIYWSTGRLQADLDAEADRDYARRRHIAVMRELGLDENGVDEEVRRMYADQLHLADDDHPSRAWVNAAIAAQEDAETIWSAQHDGDLHALVDEAFTDAQPSPAAAASGAFVVGCVASAIRSG